MFFPYFTYTNAIILKFWVALPVLKMYFKEKIAVYLKITKWKKLKQQKQNKKHHPRKKTTTHKRPDLDFNPGRHTPKLNCFTYWACTNNNQNNSNEWID